MLHLTCGLGLYNIIIIRVYHRESVIQKKSGSNFGDWKVQWFIYFSNLQDNHTGKIYSMIIKSQPNVSLFIPDMTISWNFIIFISSNDNMDGKTIECYAFSFYHWIWRQIAPNKNKRLIWNNISLCAKDFKVDNIVPKADVKYSTFLYSTSIHSHCIAVVKVRECYSVSLSRSPSSIDDEYFYNVILH